MRRRGTPVGRSASLALVVAAALAARPESTRAQAPARLLGQVLDATTQGPVAQAEVAAGDLRTVTGPDGGFLLGSVTPGRVRVEVRRIGYAPWSAVIDLVPGLDRSLRIALAPAAVRLDSIMVSASGGGITIGGAELARRGGDLARALDGWEGVVVRRTGSAGPAAPQLRGGGPEEVLVLVDGFALNDPLTGRADLSRIPSRNVEKITLVPGAQTVRAGSRAIAGVLAIETRRPLRPEGQSWLASYGARGARLGASAGLLGLAASTERHASRFPYRVPEVRGGGEADRRNAGGTQSTAFLRIDGPLELTVRGSQSERGLPGTTTNPTPQARAEDRSVVLGLRREEGLRSNASLQWIETRAADPAPPAGLPYDSYTHGISGSLDLGLRGRMAVGDWSGEGGLAVETRGDRFAGDGVRSGASFTHAALRLDAALHRGRTSVVTVAPAVRVDLWTGHTRPVASVRLDVGVLQGRTAFTAAVGSAVTPPVLADLFFREGVGVRLNPNLRPERVNWELEAGVRRDLGVGGRLGTLSVRAFAGQVRDMVIWAPDFRFVWSPRNFDVWRRGGEVSLALRPLGNVRLDGTATLAAVTYDHPGGAQVQYRPRATGTAGARWSRGAWDADMRWHLIGARFPNSAGTNARPAISLLDLGVDRRLGETLALRAAISDLTDARAEFIAGYPTPGRTMSVTLTFQVP